MSDLYLGFDLSTQQLKCFAIDSKCQKQSEFIVDFEQDLSHYGTVRGYLASDHGSKVVTAPVEMWLEAIDLVFEKMTKASFDFSKVKAISGDAQQHGTVYWSKEGIAKLENLNPTMTLKENLNSKLCFTREFSPIWMDFSTEAQCKQLTQKFGSEILQKTGSVATERFGGAQIMRFKTTEPEKFNETPKISIISSFFCSVLLGKIAPIDFNEATGTNLFDFTEQKWHKSICDFIDPNLTGKLGDPVPSRTICGSISKYFYNRYKFPENCKIVAFTGDNAASLFISGLVQSDALVTLGSSDCVFFFTSTPTPRGGCHIFGDPACKDNFFSLCCFKNSSLARMKVRDQCGLDNWSDFDNLVKETNPGNDGCFGIYFYEPESCPPGAQGLAKVKRSNGQTVAVDKFSPKGSECRAILESQVVARLYHAEQAGFKIVPGQTRVLLTGGASRNKVLPQIFADVFQSPVFVTENPNSAAFGNALRAMDALDCFDRQQFKADPWVLIAEPRAHLKDVYEDMKQLYHHTLQNLLPQ